MDAKELTKKYHELEGKVLKMEKELEFLKSEYEKQRMLLSDLRIDVKMLEGRR